MLIMLDMSRKDLTHPTMKAKDHYPQGKTKKKVRVIKDELGGELMKDVVALRRKTYSYFTVDVHGDVYYTFSDDWKAKGTKKFVIK